MMTTHSATASADKITPMTKSASVTISPNASIYPAYHTRTRYSNRAKV
jgi:hypothetical protein